MLNFVTLSQICKKSNKPIYQYLRIHSLNSALGLIVPTLSFVGFAPHYFSFALDWKARVYRCVIMSSASTLYLFRNVLDVAIALERHSLLVVWLRRFTTKSPYLVSLLLFIVCSLVNSPTYFIAQPKSDAAFFNGTISAVTNNYCIEQAFFKTVLGTSITFGVFVVRDLLTIVAEITFSALNVWQLRGFRVNFRVSNFGDTRIAESERQLVLITVHILIVSVASHIVVLIRSVSFALSLESVFDGWLTFLALLSVVVSACFNFFIVFFHSRAFRESFRRLVHLTNHRI